MLKYLKSPDTLLKAGNVTIPSFLSNDLANKDDIVIADFGEEWEKFSEFSESDLTTVGISYFSLLQKTNISKTSCALDIGCGTGRWAYYLSDKVKFIEAIDPSKAVYTAGKMLSTRDNVRVSQCDLDNIPFAENSFDLVYSLGVLHHIPDTPKAINKSVSFVKPGGVFLVYLYYALDNRGPLFKALFHFSNLFRWGISRLPRRLKLLICDLIALTIYVPLVGLSKLIKRLNPKGKLWRKIPLSVYAIHDNSFNILRNDALDRFGTRLEQRFTRKEIKELLENAGLLNIQFSENPPYWVAMGNRK